MPEFHYVKQGKQSGPVTREELQRMAAAGELDRADTVWTQGMTTWSQAGSVEGIFPAPTVRLEYAGFAVRTAARVIDQLCFLVLGIAGGVAGGIVLAVLQAMGRVGPDWAQKVQANGPENLLFGLAAMLCYHASCEGLYGASLGKLVFGLRVLGADGSACGLKAGVIRTLGFFPDSLFFGLVAYSKMSKSPQLQRYGDGWADTVVVKSASVPAGSRRSLGELAAALALGAGGAAALDLAGVLVKALR